MKKGRTTIDRRARVEPDGVDGRRRGRVRSRRAGWCRSRREFAPNRIDLIADVSRRLDASVAVFLEALPDKPAERARQIVPSAPQSAALGLSGSRK